MVYGVSLEEQLLRDGSDIPVIVKKCVEYIETHGNHLSLFLLNIIGMHQEGIYRRSGSSIKVNKIRDIFNLDASDVQLEDLDAATDVDNVAGALKLYLRELPNSTVPSNYWPGFLAAHRTNNGDTDQFNALEKALEKLPTANYNLLKYMIVHLSRVSTFEEDNKMSISNISIVFGPTLFPPAHSTNAVELMGQQCGVTMHLLSLASSLFGSSPHLH